LSSPPPDDLDDDAAAISQGQALYQAMNCAGCHSAHGGGAIGPALSDDKWIYGWQPQVIFDSIVHGRPNGMPSFADRMPDYEVWKIVGYVRSLSGLGSAQAAPGRGDHLAAGAPPNSLARPVPRSDTATLESLQAGDRSEFSRRGWIDSRTGEIRVPSNIANAVEQQSRNVPPGSRQNRR
jgi:hypothetical protein